MKNGISIKNQRVFTGTFLTLAILGAVLWLIGGGLEQAGIPLFFIGLAGFMFHDFVPMVISSARRSRLARAVSNPRLARELVWQEHGRALAAIGILYHHYIKFYPRWARRRNDYYVPGVVSEASAFSNHRIRIVLNGHEYLFSFTDAALNEINPTGLSRGLLELFSNNEKVLGLHMVEEQSEVGPYWKVIGLDTYVDGPWRKDFQQLHEKIAQDIEDRKRDSRQAG